MTGLPDNLLQALCDQLPDEKDYKPITLTKRWCLILFLFKLRHNPKLNVLSSLFSVSISTASRIVNSYMPIVYEASNHFSPVVWPSTFEDVPSGFCGAQVLIDCSSHLRARVHPGQQLYYRGDVGFHQLTSQVITDIEGIT
jgi:hypothetical protein